jgi:hypothetical protein
MPGSCEKSHLHKTHFPNRLFCGRLCILHLPCHHFPENILQESAPHDVLCMRRQWCFDWINNRSTTFSNISCHKTCEVNLMNAVKWVLIDGTNGATTNDGSKLSPGVLANIAEAVTSQVNQEFAAEWGAQASIRVGADANDIQPGEWAYVFLASLPDAPGASAYHDINGNGVPFALCAVQTCTDLYGPSGVCVDASHEILETAGDQGANLFANDNKGLLHALEMCDAVEVQTYGKKCKDGTVAQVSNWLLRSWFMPGAAGPYDYMSSAKLAGAVAPPGPLQTAPGNGGNYQIVSQANGTQQVFAVARHIQGKRRKGAVPNWSSRAGRRLAMMKQMG